MVQTMFETYSKYRDSVFYDASAWSVANFYNMPYRGLKSSKLGEEVDENFSFISNPEVTKSDYAYIIDWDDYNAPAALYYILKYTSFHDRKYNSVAQFSVYFTIK